MKKILLKTTAIAAAVSMLASTIMPVLADSATNDTTGAGSTNTSDVVNTNNVAVTNVSDAYIHNEVKSTSNTGGNSASRNTLGGMVQTGDATTDVAVVNSANINTNMIDLGRGEGSNTAGNSITGAGSGNFANIANTNAVRVRNDNTAVLDNKVDAVSNTGNNMANENTDGGGGMVQSGDAQTVVSLANRANDSATSVSGLANFGSNVVGNSITGADSTNRADIVNSNSVAVTNVSDAAVWNRVRARGNTGGNSASRNTLGGMVQSGDAGVDIEMLTDANINTTAIANAMSDFNGTSGNSITGAGSGNFTTLANNNNFVVVNRNNKGSSEDAPDYECQDGDSKCRFRWGVVNEDVDMANTGENMANGNTFSASIASGIASVGKYIRVCLNDTLTSIGALLP